MWKLKSSSFPCSDKEQAPPPPPPPPTNQNNLQLSPLLLSTGKHQTQVILCPSDKQKSGSMRPPSVTTLLGVLASDLMAVRDVLSDGLEFEEATKAKSCQAVNSFRQLVATQSPLFVIDDHGLYMT
ncbi:hypothetical protein PAMA_002681 [Pampus argenteus]